MLVTALSSAHGKTVTHTARAMTVSALLYFTHSLQDKDNLIFNCTDLKLSLSQYKAVALARGLSGGLGLALCFLLLAILLLVTKNKTWENFSKRLSLGIILSTAAYMMLVAAGTWYKHPPPDQSIPCTVVGVLHFYSEIAMRLFYILTFLSLLFQVLRSAFPDTFMAQVQRNFKKRNSHKQWEVGLFIVIPLLPSLMVWEPFLPGVTSYGSHGTSCWLHYELNTTDCKEKGGSTQSIYVWVLISASALIVCLSVMLTLAALCHVYLKFRGTKIATNIRKALLNLGIVLLVVFIAILGILYSTLLSTYARYLGFASWVQGEIGSPLFAIINMILMVLYIHYTAFAEACCRAITKTHLQTNKTEQCTNPSSVWDHRNVPSVTYYSPPLESGIRSISTEQTPIVTSNMRALYDAINSS